MASAISIAVAERSTGNLAIFKTASLGKSRDKAHAQPSGETGLLSMECRLTARSGGFYGMAIRPYCDVTCLGLILLKPLNSTLNVLLSLLAVSH
jgi:hypothetical protein